ncbi:hypothetical protein PR048_020684 [Dryococelus australis]|uniref:Uncharacterized protein n=1 Tax=Dryococelus australis TaxID=614101 RepID=A0ABQ9H713_9NEOP|nr:hypothetical protein PR048_020684 [Dryococelus australis]
MKGRGKREIPEKTRRPAVSFDTIATRENLRAAPPEFEPGSPRTQSCLTSPGSEVSMEKRRNGRAGESGYPRENPSASGVDRQDCHMREFGSDPAANRTRFTWA